ncbi:MaoC family dehydratase [Rhizobium sp. FKY42]|uniref:MaoC family dehydratase n=1 Tax=Rhizobium sp. FKY42 TaxID=2562310 RepID=UPI0010C14D6E|nr:MaoC family dehydratase [Rhizobium sp. FKY42]
MRMEELNAVGTRLNLGTMAFTAENIIEFARKFDPQPFHMDAEAAKDFVFGALCASGWQSAAGWMKTFLAYWTKECIRLHKQGIAPPKLGPSPGFRKLQWLKPVYAGDRITYYTTLLNSRELASRPGVWLNSTLNEGVNQNGETVIRFESSVLEFT